MSTTFWATHQVGGPYVTLEESQEALAQRQLASFPHCELMPVEYPGTDRSGLRLWARPRHAALLPARRGARLLLRHLAVGAGDRGREARDARARRPREPDEEGPYPARRPCPLRRRSPPHVQSRRGAAGICAGRSSTRGDARVMIYDGDRSTHTKFQGSDNTDGGRRGVQASGLPSRAGFKPRTSGVTSARRRGVQLLRRLLRAVLSVVIPTLTGREETLRALQGGVPGDRPRRHGDIVVVKDRASWPEACNEGSGWLRATGSTSPPTTSSRYRAGGKTLLLAR